MALVTLSSALRADAGVVKGVTGDTSMADGSWFPEAVEMEGLSPEFSRGASYLSKLHL